MRIWIRDPRLWLLVITLLWLPINLFSLSSYPAPNGDEAWIGSMSADYIESGRFDVQVFGSVNGVFTNYLIWHLYSVGLAGVFRVFGIGLVQARLFSVVGALVGGWLLFFLSRRLYDDSIGLLSTALYLFSLRTLLPSHLVRPDTWVNAVGVLCFLLFCYVSRSRRPFAAFIAGLGVAVAVDVYVVVVYFSLIVSLAMLVEFGNRSGWKLLVWFALGGVIGTAYWLAIRLYPDPVATLAQWRYQSVYAVSLEPLTSSHILEIAAVTIRSGLIGHSRLGGLETGYIVAGLIGLLIRRQKSDYFLLLGWIGLWFGYFYPYKGLGHLVELVPLFALSMSVAIMMFSRWLTGCLRANRPSASHVALTLAGTLVAGYIAGHVVVGWQSKAIDYDRYTRQLSTMIPVKSSILGEGTWWWQFRGYMYTSDDYLHYYWLAHRELQAAQVIQVVVEERQVNVILLDEHISFHKDSGQPAFEAVLRDYVRANCALKGTVAEYGYGVEMGGPAIKRTEVFLCPTPGAR